MVRLILNLVFRSITGNKVLDQDTLYSLEQAYLDILFTLPFNFRYNICPTADIRDMIGPFPTNIGGKSREGEKNPNFGKVSTNALPVKIYDC